MSHYELLDRQYDRRGGRGTKRVGVVDWSQMMSGTAALFEAQTAKPALSIYRIGQGLTIYRDGTPYAARITNIARGAGLGAVFTIVCGDERITLTRAALDDLTAPPTVDPNIPLLPAWIPERETPAPQPRIYTTFNVDFSRPRAPRVIYAFAPEKTGAA